MDGRVGDRPPSYVAYRLYGRALANWDDLDGRLLLAGLAGGVESLTLRQLLNTEYAAEVESASIKGEAAVAQYHSELERPPPGMRRRGRAVSVVTSELEDLMRPA